MTSEPSGGGNIVIMERDPKEFDESTVDENAEETASDGIDENDVDALNAALEQERAQSEEYLDQARRATAELVNYRRRTDQERELLQKRAAERVLGRFLPAIDDLNRAVDAIPESEREKPWSQGVILIQKKLWQTLESEGVHPIESLGQTFDPSMHEAVSVMGDGDKADTVVQEFQRGYMLHDKVLRPAMVVVGREEDLPSDSSPGTEDENK